MYNQELKERFLIQYTDSALTRRSAFNVFEALAKYEEKYGTDIYQMDAESMRSIFDEVSGVKSRTAENSLLILRAYSRWCRQQGLPGANDSLENIEIDSISKLRSFMISGPLELSIYLDQLHDSKAEECRLDNVYRAYDWLAFMDVDEQDVMSLTEQNVDLNHMELCYGNRYIEIPREAYTVFRNLVTQKEFLYVHTNPYYETLRTRVPGDFLLRGVRAELTDHVQLRDKVSSIRALALRAGRIQKQLSRSRIRNSGVFYRAYELERAGLTPDFSSIIARECSTAGLSEEEYEQIKRKRRDAIRNYAKDYERWKLAFVRL